MTVLGIDPGYAIIGYGVVNAEKSAFTPVAYGCITTDADTDFNERLKLIFEGMNKVIEKAKPDCIAIEKLYFQNNQKTAIMVAEARGVILLCAQLHNIEIFEYTPLQVKTAVTGYGKAKKQQVMDMTKRLLKLRAMPKPDDAADALAIAVCHIQAAGTTLRQRLMNGL
ncbi:MAG: crossover junction endodeoxyribonuclease RuvC [Clostridia bacterium]|nr:crossover junction endodeoxyribonuclease RuvC [Clostridia bacterium]